MLAVYRMHGNPPRGIDELPIAEVYFELEGFRKALPTARPKL